MDVPVHGRRIADTVLPIEMCRTLLLMLDGRPSGRWDRGPFWCRLDGNAFALVQGDVPWLGPWGPSTLAITGRLVPLPVGTMVEYRHVVRAWALLAAGAAVLAIAFLLAARAGAFPALVAPEHTINGFSMDVFALCLCAIPIGMVGSVILELRNNRLLRTLERELKLVDFTKQRAA